MERMGELDLGSTSFWGIRFRRSSSSSSEDDSLASIDGTSNQQSIKQSFLCLSGAFDKKAQCSSSTSSSSS